MNEEIIKKIAEEEFINNTMKHLDSALIFVYIKNLEKENVELNRMCEIYSQSLYNADLKKAEQEIDRLNNIINELEKYIHNELVLDFYNDDMPCELIINKMEKMIKTLKEE